MVAVPGLRNHTTRLVPPPTFILHPTQSSPPAQKHTPCTPPGTIYIGDNKFWISYWQPLVKHHKPTLQKIVYWLCRVLLGSILWHLLWHCSYYSTHSLARLYNNIFFPRILEELPLLPPWRKCLLGNRTSKLDTRLHSMKLRWLCMWTRWYTMYSKKTAPQWRKTSFRRPNYRNTCALTRLTNLKIILPNTAFRALE